MPLIPTNPPPQANDRPPVWEAVIKDMQARDYVGRERYGVPLQAFNGRDALLDAYEEALDLAVYLKQAIQEREANITQMDDLKASVQRLRDQAEDQAQDARDLISIVEQELFQSRGMK